MSKSSRLRVPAVVPFGQRRALRARLDDALPPLIRKDGQQLPPKVKERLLEQLSDAALSAAPGFELGVAATLDRNTLAAVATAINANVSSKDTTAIGRLSAAGKLVAQEVRTASKRGMQVAPQGAGRPADVWKNTLMADVRQALQDANVRGTYWKTGTESTLTKVFRACAKAAGYPIPGDLRNVVRGSQRPVRLRPFKASKTTSRRPKSS